MPRIFALGLMVMALALLVPTAVFAYTNGSPSGATNTSVSHQEGDDAELEARPWIGVSLVPLNERLAEHLELDVEEGIVVVRVHPESPAAEAGFERGDIVLTVGTEAVDGVVDVVEAVGATIPGDTLDFGVLRGAENLALSVAVGSRPAPQHQDRPQHRPAHAKSAPWVGMVIVPLNENLAERLEIDATEGIVVLQVREDSPAATAGIAKGDVILSIGDLTVEKMTDIVQTVREAEAGDVLTFTVARQGEVDPVFVDITVAEGPQPSGEGHRIPYLNLIAPMAGHLLEGEFIINDKEGNQVTLTVVTGVVSGIGEDSLVISPAADGSDDLALTIGEETVIVKAGSKETLEALAVDDEVIVVIKDGELAAVLVKPLRHARSGLGQLPGFGGTGDQSGQRPPFFSQDRGQQRGNSQRSFQFRGNAPEVFGDLQERFGELQERFGQFQRGNDRQSRGNAPEIFGKLQERFGELQERFGRTQGEDRQRFQGNAPRRGDQSESAVPAPSKVEPAPTGSTNL